MTRVDCKILIQAMNKLGHSVFENDTRNYNLNFIGVRSKDMTPGVFNDIMVAMWKHRGSWNILQFPCTTDPGVYYLEHPLNVIGTGILKPGQYKGMWTQGFHQGKYPAYTQNAPCTLYRDNDKDNEMDIVGVKEETGMFGINGHRAMENLKTQRVGKFSAGCQVIQSPNDYEIWFNLGQAAIFEGWSNKFTYTLIKEQNL